MSRNFLSFIYIHIVFFYSSQQASNNTVKEDEFKLDWDVWCKYQPNAYDCDGRGIKERFYYDLKLEDCKSAQVGSCRHNKNQFASMTDCHFFCGEVGHLQIKTNLSEKVYCRFQPDFGQCNSYYPMWYFDVSIRTCKGFSYSGCGGNHNRFPTAQICTAVCGGVIEYGNLY